MAVFHVRRLPHHHPAGRPIFLTWRLAGSLPAGRWFPPRIASGKAFLAMDRLLDEARSGPLYLRQPEIAKTIVDSIRYRDGGPYRLHNYVVMANHLHLLITAEIQVSKAMQSLKRHTARECNRILALTGQPFWQDESYDRVVRNSEEFKSIAAYIEQNPVRAGLSAVPEDFPWSSAWPIANRLQDAILPHS